MKYIEKTQAKKIVLIMTILRSTSNYFHIKFLRGLDKSFIVAEFSNQP